MALIKSVRAAGGVLRRIGPDGLEVLLVHRPRYDDWSFPKGKAIARESDEETALREVEEETGIRATLGVELPSSRYRDARGRPKVVRYWTMTPESGSFEPHDEVDELKWLPIDRAERELSYRRDRELLRALPPPLLVVRHGSAGVAWEERDDARRPLDERGRAQADGLVDQLRAFELSRIVSSPFDRCVETVDPLARSRELELETSDVLAEGAGADRVRAFLLDQAGKAVMACGHGPELTPLFGKMKKGATVVLEPGDTRLLELGRFPPPG